MRYSSSASLAYLYQEKPETVIPKQIIQLVAIDKFREMALSYAEAIEFPHFELTAFSVNKKIFATLDVKRQRACLMLSPIDQSVFIAFDQTVIYPVPNKWGKNGATYVELKTVRKTMLKDGLRKAYQKALSGKENPTVKDR